MRTFGYEPRIWPNTPPGAKPSRSNIVDYQNSPQPQLQPLSQSLIQTLPKPPLPLSQSPVQALPQPLPQSQSLSQTPPRPEPLNQPLNLPMSQSEPNPQLADKHRFSFKLPWVRQTHPVTEPSPQNAAASQTEPSPNGQTLESLLAGNPTLQQAGIYFVKQFGPPLLRQFGPPAARRFGLPIMKRLGPPLARRVGLPILKRVGLPLARKAGMFLIKRIFP